jgi:hypothetical protein
LAAWSLATVVFFLESPFATVYLDPLEDLAFGFEEFVEGFFDGALLATVLGELLLASAFEPALKA